MYSIILSDMSMWELAHKHAILICGESGDNGRTYDLAERYRSLRSI